MSKMNPEIKAKWVAALRSGEYQQGQGCLRMDGVSTVEHCCLGVLTDLAVQDGVTYWEKYEGAEFFGEDVVSWANLPNEDPEATEPEWGEKARLSQFNDNGKTFEQIADIIEAQL